jgi:hypothetical protein
MSNTKNGRRFTLKIFSHLLGRWPGFNGVLWSEACRARLVEPKTLKSMPSVRVPPALWVVPGALEMNWSGMLLACCWYVSYVSYVFWEF